MLFRSVGVVIDMKNGKIKVEVNDESIVFDVYKMIKTSPPIEVYGRINSIDIIDECVQDVVNEYVGKTLCWILYHKRLMTSIPIRRL